MRLTIKCGIIKLTKRKQKLLDDEYSNLQLFLKGQDVPLYSANKQQALRQYKKIKLKEYPISLRNDLINLKKTESFWFLKVPVHGAYGGIRLPIKPHRKIPEGKLCESKLFKKNGKYFVNLVFEFDTPMRNSFSSVLAIDLGERVPATAVLLQNGNVMKAKFFGKEVRGIRRHYAWLRKRLGKKKLPKVIKRIGQKEYRLVNDILHKVSCEIVNLADSSNSCIILGNLKGIRKSAKGKGRRFNRIISSMPFYKLTEMIKYKAMLKGIPVVAVDEAYTSQTCHICGKIGKRRTQGLFFCKTCGEYNADLNGAINIGNRFLPYMGLNGATCGLVLNRCDETFVYDSTSETNHFNG